ncbi:metallophosphoesterase [Halobacillus sp. B29]|uniref:metallophosphoesterase n=1 Tax=Halobacillus sp. B29 TaxID=3457432 RepID=UPI003FCE79AF
MKLTRRKFIKNMVRSILGFLGLSGLSYYYAKYIEPDLLTVKKFSINHSKIPKSFHNVDILQFSDTHIGFHYDLNKFEQLVETINQRKPDLILFTGDLVDEPQTYSFTDRLPALLNRLEAPLGKYWIYGNHDHGGYGTEKIYEVMSRGGFTLLQNEHTSIQKDGEAFTLAGLDDVMLGRPDIEETLAQHNENSFTLFLAHEPDIADQVQRYGVDVQLSGHSHGGQVQLPIYGYLVTPPLAEKYVEGHYRLPDGMDLFVSRGLGTTRMPYRFLCRPELSIFRLKSPEI